VELKKFGGGGAPQGQPQNMQRQVEYQRDQMNRQDEALEEILSGVHGLKSHAIDIGEEAEDQTRMLDEIGNATEHAEGGSILRFFSLTAHYH
jgi:methyl-accepting chemotaxis protein